MTQRRYGEEVQDTGPIGARKKLSKQFGAGGRPVSSMRGSHGAKTVEVAGGAGA